MLTVIFLSLCFSLSIVYLTPKISSFINSNDSRKLHSVTLTEKYMNEGDETRESTNKVIFAHPEWFYVPQGFGWQNHVKRIQRITDRAALSSMDSNLLYFVYHFGFILGLTLIISMILFIVNSLVKSLRFNDFETFLILLSLAVVFLSMFILKSWIVVYLNYACSYSFILFLIAYQAKSYGDGLDLLPKKKDKLK